MSTRVIGGPHCKGCANKHQDMRDFALHHAGLADLLLAEVTKMKKQRKRKKQKGPNP